MSVTWDIWVRLFDFWEFLFSRERQQMSSLFNELAPGARRLLVFPHKRMNSPVLHSFIMNGVEVSNSAPPPSLDGLGRFLLLWTRVEP